MDGARRLDDVERLGRLAVEFGSAREPMQVYRALRDFVGATTAMNGFFVARYDGEKELRTCVFAHTDGVEFDASALPVLPMNGSPNSRAIQTREVVLVTDYLAATSSAPVTWVGTEVNPARTTCSLVVPMIARGRVLGTMTIQSPDPDAFGERDVVFHRMATNLAALAVENLELLEAERRVSATLEERVRERTRDLERASADLREHAMARDLAKRLLKGIARKGGVRPDTLRALGRELAIGMAPAASMRSMVSAFDLMGLGRLGLERDEPGRYAVEGFDLLEREPGASQPTCFLTLGFLEGAVAALHDGPALGSEVACQSQGHAACRFVVSSRRGDETGAMPPPRQPKPREPGRAS